MLKTLNQIINEIKPSSYIGLFDVGEPYPQRGQFVIRASPFATALSRVGFVVQIRVGRGQFKSDMYFLRLADGQLITSENDAYLPMTPEQEEMARSVFKLLPEDEGFEDEPEYRDCAKIGEKGFIIHNSASQPTPDTPFTITITKESPNTETKGN